ncbi:hypothetical protein [Myroides fluvii]|uniref:hypothetical protein n=1 Tax=Myroides fluvii TaxID=2572594 RepID=UPI00131B122C|nr:hypothetical protein [Myroides fluvii]
MRKYNLQTLLVFFMVTIVGITAQAQTKNFGKTIGDLMYEMTVNQPNTEKIQQILETLHMDNKEVKTGPLSYSIFDGFDGDKMYYIPFTTPEESRFTVEQLKRADKYYFGAQFLLKSEYTVDAKKQVQYKEDNYAYNTNYNELSLYCTTPMKYKNGSGNNPESPLLSCIYTNPTSKKRMMYWVVFEKPIGDTQGNTIKEIKFQSIELWQN